MTDDQGHWTKDPLLAFIKALETVKNPRGAAVALIEALLDEADYSAVWRVLGPTLTPWVGTPLPHAPEKLLLSSENSPLALCLSRGQALFAPLGEEPLVFDFFKERPDCASWTLALVPVTVAGRHPAVLLLAGNNPALPARLVVYGQLVAQFGAYLTRLASHSSQAAQSAAAEDVLRAATPAPALPDAALESPSEKSVAADPPPADAEPPSPSLAPEPDAPALEVPVPEASAPEAASALPEAAEPETPRPQAPDWGHLYVQARQRVRKN